MVIINEWYWVITNIPSSETSSMIEWCKRIDSLEDNRYYIDNKKWDMTRDTRGNAVFWFRNEEDQVQFKLTFL